MIKETLQLSDAKVGLVDKVENIGILLSMEH
jgi:hypothetical protein